VTTGIAPGSKKAFREDAAFQIPTKLVLDVPRQSALVVVARVGEKGFQVLPHEAVEDGLGGAARKIGGRESSHDRDGFAGSVPEIGSRTSGACGPRRLSRTDHRWPRTLAPTPPASSFPVQTPSHSSL
jgi:hypothetical protein